MNNQIIKISFDIPYQVHNDRMSIIQLTGLVDSLSKSVQSSSRKNSQDNICSYSLGLIHLIENKIKISDGDILNVSFVVELQNPNSNLELKDIEEIIWCVMPSTYDNAGIINFSKDGMFRTLNYSLKVLDTPSNIIYTF